jgi:hypothetical protein
MLITHFIALSSYQANTICVVVFVGGGHKTNTCHLLSFPPKKKNNPVTNGFSPTAHNLTRKRSENDKTF